MTIFKNTILFVLSCFIINNFYYYQLVLDLFKIVLGVSIVLVFFLSFIHLTSRGPGKIFPIIRDTIITIAGATTAYVNMAGGPPGKGDDEDKKKEEEAKRRGDALKEREAMKKQIAEQAQAQQAMNERLAKLEAMKNLKR